MGPASVQRTPHKLDGLTSQARYVRGHFSRRAMHASGDSPWHSSAKHHILEACFFRMTPFRSMLLTVQAVTQKSPCEGKRVIMGEESALKLSQRGLDARQGGAHENPEAIIRPRTYDLST